MSMSRLATTPGNRLVMPRSSTAGGTASAAGSAAGSAEMVHLHFLELSLLPGGDGHAAVHDLRLRLVGLGGERGDRGVRGRVADAAGLEVEPLGALEDAAVDRGLDEVEDGHVDLLEHGGQDDRLEVVGRGLVLVGVDA